MMKSKSENNGNMDKQNDDIDGFTVIMPTYNQSGFIRNAIRSIFEQTLKIGVVFYTIKIKRTFSTSINN